MKVKNIMTSDVHKCGPDDDLAAAAAIMWTNDCGAIPVMDEDQQAVGMITDRDICMTLFLQGKSPNQVRVRDVMSSMVHSVSPEDDIQDALDLMAEHQLRRLPALNADGTVCGILSISDIVRNSGKGKSKKHVSTREVIKLIKAVTESRQSKRESSKESIVAETFTPEDVAQLGFEAEQTDTEPNSK